jgi:hypothetical protein
MEKDFLGPAGAWRNLDALARGAFPALPDAWRGAVISMHAVAGSIAATH